MDKSLRIQLEWYWEHGIQGLTQSQLLDYIWHLEQLTEILRKVIQERIPARINSD
ncbi:hypothetical protein ES705_34742 [subsurface metagenome]